jgi:hypothetical protein
MSFKSCRRTLAFRRVAVAAALAIAIASVPGALWAQQMAPTMPDPSAAGEPAPLYDPGAADQTQPPDPMSAVDDPGDSAAVAIPGGGEVQAQDPAVPDSGPQIPPTETWSGTRIDPEGSAGAPMGP